MFSNDHNRAAGARATGERRRRRRAASARAGRGGRQRDQKAHRTDTRGGGHE